MCITFIDNSQLSEDTRRKRAKLSALKRSWRKQGSVQQQQRNIRSLVPSLSCFLFISIFLSHSHSMALPQSTQIEMEKNDNISGNGAMCLPVRSLPQHKFEWPFGGSVSANKTFHAPCITLSFTFVLLPASDSNTSGLFFLILYLYVSALCWTLRWSALGRGQYECYVHSRKRGCALSWNRSWGI